MADLRPCPYCEANSWEVKSILVDPPESDDEVRMQQCIECGCIAGGETEEEANRRPIEDALRARAEAAEAELYRIESTVFVDLLRERDEARARLLDGVSQLRNTQRERDEARMEIKRLWQAWHKLSLDHFEPSPFCFLIRLRPCPRTIAFGIELTEHDFGGKPWRPQSFILRVYFYKWQFCKSFRRTNVDTKNQPRRL